MEAAAADGTAPSADRGDSGRAATADGTAPVANESDQNGVAVADSSSRGRMKQWWRTEPTVADGGGTARMEVAVIDVGTTDIM